MELTCADLGLFAYDLRLVAGEPKHERPTYFQTNLGMQQVQQVKIVNYCKTKCDFSLKVSESASTHILSFAPCKRKNKAK